MSSTATVHSEALAVTGLPPRCQLVVVEGPDQGRAVSLAGAEVVAGTDPDCDLVLTDPRVSRRHLAVRPEAGAFVVRDLGSTNGTRYEGSQVSELRVRAGATLAAGRSFLRIQPQPQALQIVPSTSRRFGDLWGESLAMREVFAVLELAAESAITVLLEGETGTGKELAARALHEASPRRRAPFVAIDCGALPGSLVESELFGHVRGAFTGASERRAGAFVRARGGTLFLDELGGVPAPVQARLLRVLEERRVRPVGADDEREVDVRVVAASRDDLAAAVARGDFRADLYYRLSVLRVVLPPLRARREDLAGIVRELLRRRGLEDLEVQGPGLDLLVGHDWPGNVRELRNVLDRALALAPRARCFTDLRIDVAPAAVAAPPAVRTDLPWAEARQQVLNDFEKRYLAEVLTRAGGNLAAAARRAGLDRKHLRLLARRHGLVPGGSRG